MILSFQIFTVFYFISILIPTFWFKYQNLIYSSNKFTKNKFWYAVPQLLRKCNFLNCHYDGELTATLFTVSYLIVCSLIESLWPRYHLCRIYCIIRCLLFSIVNEIYDYYEAQSAISLFQINELFSYHFWGFKLKIFYPRNVRNPIRFPDLSNKYVSIFLTST